MAIEAPMVIVEEKNIENKIAEPENNIINKNNNPQNANDIFV